MIDRPDDPEFALGTRELDARTELVEATGPVDHLFAAPEFKEALMRTIDSGKRWIIVDLTGATLVDSTVLGALLTVRRRLLARHGGLAVVCAEPGIRKIFEITGLDRTFPVAAERDDALQALHAAR